MNEHEQNIKSTKNQKIEFITFFTKIRKNNICLEKFLKMNLFGDEIELVLNNIKSIIKDSSLKF